jgi:transcriptional regulator with XRE-family HTH domain
VDRLAELRESQGLTLRDLAERSGVDANTINQVELGHRKPRPSTLRKLAKALNVEVADFFREPAVPLVEVPREAGPDSGYTKEDRLEILRRMEMAILTIAERCRRDLETIDTSATDRKTKGDRLISVLAQAFWSYKGAKQYVHEDEIMREAIEGASEEGRAARRVYAALTELSKTFDDIRSVVESFASPADSSDGGESATITYIEDRLRERAS